MSFIFIFQWSYVVPQINLGLVSVISSKCINPNIWIKNGHDIDNVYNVYYISQKLHKHLYSV